MIPQVGAVVSFVGTPDKRFHNAETVSGRNRLYVVNNLDTDAPVALGSPDADQRLNGILGTPAFQ
ncbi:hypothetical protein [Arthrobacter sp. 92]|jgi:hypothetical protein|uniref:hypothetical protein n=1 Tax=Arthrobacter sp. 92 TaxID=3418175 RepID=UPI003D038E34